MKVFRHEYQAALRVATGTNRFTVAARCAADRIRLDAEQGTSYANRDDLALVLCADEGIAGLESEGA